MFIYYIFPVKNLLDKYFINCDNEVERQEEITLREETAKKFVRKLEKNWKKHSVNEIITNLITEVNNYRNEMYQSVEEITQVVETINI